MLTRMFAPWSISCVSICVLLLFFFPVAQGPFQATHGPITVFRARKALLMLVFLVLDAAAGVLARAGKSCISALRLLLSHSGSGLAGVQPGDCRAVLRC